ncbi:MAG: outer membrane lipoprotein carrier protein LolA, partial [Bacteroidales bacterium]|nr:outer membrane lipoprotein carrier protein LolA [Bacteroidales bacterium]
MFKNVILCLLLFTSIAVIAQNRPLTLKESENFRNKVQETTRKTTTIESDFTQEKEMSMMAEKITSTGKFYFRKEKMLRWEYMKPF